MIGKTVSFPVLLLLLCGALAQSVRAQDERSGTPAPATQQNEATESSAEAADLAITANVTARELRFEVVPEPKVVFTGKPERVTVWEAERQNLPRPVEPGVTYRNIGIQLKITSVFADIDRIVAEALGEVPTSDDASPPQTEPRRTEPVQTEPPTQQQNPTPPSSSSTSSRNQPASEGTPQ